MFHLICLRIIKSICMKICRLQDSSVTFSPHPLFFPARELVAWCPSLAPDSLSCSLVGHLGRRMHLLAPGATGGRARQNVAFTAILCQVQQVQVCLHRGAKHLSFLLNLVVTKDREATFCLFIYGCAGCLVLRGPSLIAVSWGFSPAVVCSLLLAVTSVAEHRLLDVCGLP